MSGRRHVVAGSSPWRSGGKGAEDRHRDGEIGEAGGERSSSETLTTATATTHTAFDIKRFINNKLDSRHRDKDKDDNSLTVVAPQRTSDSSIPTSVISRPGSVSPTPTQFSPTSTAVMASPPSSSSKILASPSKSVTASALAAAGRTYDGKLIAREMARYGALAHPPSALPTIGLSGASPSASTLALSPSGGPGGASAGAIPSGHSHGHGHGHGPGSGYGLGADSAWAQLHVLVLPLFNHEQLIKPIEDLNALVRIHISAVTSRPQRALATLEHDVSELINAGMVTLNSKLMNVDDEQLLNRVVELWGFFWDQVLPYVEGVFLPLQTSDILINLHRTPKPLHPSSPIAPDITSSSSSATPIDVRTLSLRAFRDKIIVPIAPKLEARLLAMARRDKDGIAVPGLGGSGAVTEATGYQHPRLQQMLLVLHSQAQRARRALSLTAPAPTLSPQELVIRKLLDAIVYARSPASALNGSGVGASTSFSATLSPNRRPPSFLSNGAPRDRRGRVAGKANRRALFIDDEIAPALGTRSRSALAHRHGETFFDDDASDDSRQAFDSAAAAAAGKFAQDSDVFGSETGYGGTTPRGRRSADIGAAARDAERERKRTLLESLRSPNPADDEGDGLGDEEDDGSEDDYGGTIEGGSGPSRRLSGAWTLGRYASGELERGEESSPMNWDQAQAVVERMVGMGAHAGSFESDNMPYIPPSAPPLSRRRLT